MFDTRTQLVANQAFANYLLSDIDLSGPRASSFHEVRGVDANNPRPQASDDFYDAAGNLKPEVPKKPSLNVERHSTNREACKTEKEPTEISSPRRLRVKGTDIDSLMGCRIESSETGILASDGPSEDRPIAKAHEAGETYTTAVTPELPSELTLACRSVGESATPSRGGDTPIACSNTAPVPLKKAGVA